MAGLKKSDFSGRVDEVLWCRDSATSIVSETADELFVSLAGFPNDTHAGLTRPACVRVKQLYPKGTEIKNARQLTLVSREELDAIAGDMGLDHLPPAWLGANLMLSGIPTLTLLPPSSRLQFSSGLTLVVDLENGPCIHPARVIDKHFPGKGLSFVKHATHRRGITAWVEREGNIKAGDEVEVHIPNQDRHPILEPAG
ncbi:MAG: MOSC domain-containing protein [Kiloniellales bacterium]|nr:MOSC domain-containing protein [Kiloniellales bacterium]